MASKSTGRSNGSSPRAEDVPTSQRLMATAADHFCRKGYAQTTTRELAEALGIQKASLYHHISNKEELLYSISMHSLAQIIEAVSTAIDAAPPEDRLRVLIEAHLVAALRDRDMHVVMLTEMRVLSAEHHDEVVAKRDEYDAIIRGIIVADQEAGRLRTDIEAKLLTLVLLNELNWTIFWFDPDDDLTPERIGNVLGAVFIEGAIGR